MSARKDLIEVEVLDRIIESDRVVSLILAARGGGSLPGWEPGAHIDLHHPAGLRQYSLCGDPDDQGRWRIAIGHGPDAGESVSAALARQTRPGDMLLAGTPRNSFPLVAASRYLLIGGGIGITPLLPMARKLARQAVPFTLHHASRDPGAFAAELRTHGDRVRFHGPATRLDLGALLATAGPETRIYCCGPERMIAAALALAESLGLDRRLHVERFRPVAATGETRPFSLRCAASGIDIAVGAGESALEALTRAGVFVPSSCLEGTCGSCELPVLEGRIDHRDSLLSPAERAGNDRMFACVSRAISPLLVLDL